jgi:acyl-CoA reductase-like NAD-dependent aldehyde dehydrogenase
LSTFAACRHVQPSDRRRVRAGTRHFDVIDPATGEASRRVPDASREQVDAAMTRRRVPSRAPWSRDEALRRRTLAHMSEALAARADEIGRLVCLEQGSRSRSAVGEVKGAARSQLYATSRSRATSCATTRRRASRSCDGRSAWSRAITPWNFPVATLVMKLGPALLAGKHGGREAVAVHAALLARARRGAAGAVPAGVLNVLGGSNEVGAWLTAHPACPEDLLHRQRADRKKIMRAAADDLKRVTLELGGNDPAIVLPTSTRRRSRRDSSGARSRTRDRSASRSSASTSTRTSTARSSPASPSSRSR